MKQISILDEFGKKHTVDESELIDRTSAYGIFLKDGKLLLVQDKNSRTWEFPGGGLEAGESLEQGLAREFWEETGLKISQQNIKFFSRHNGYFYSTFYNQPWHSFRNFYFVEVISGDLLENGNGDDTVASGYFDKVEIKRLKIKPKIRELINKVFIILT